MALERSDNAWLVRTELPVEYKVQLVTGLLDSTFPEPTSPDARYDPLGRVLGGSPRRVVVVDATVMRLYGDAIRAWLDRHQLEPHFVVIPGGEQSKRMRNVQRICRAFDKVGVPRHARPVTVIAIGGGVITDLVGVAATLYRRGVHRINVPTTLVGMVDAALAAKTGIDFDGRKNRLGSYYPPDLVLIDRRFLATLDQRRISDGLAELAKIGLGMDKVLFEELERNGLLLISQRFQGTTAAGELAATIVFDRGITGILTELASNLFEHHSVKASYLGHLFPWIEMAALRDSRSWLPWRRRPWLYHGEVVSLDMLLAAGIAVDDGLLAVDDYLRVATLLADLGLPIWDRLLSDEDLLWRSLQDTTLHRGNEQLAPLPKGIGAVHFSNDVTRAKLRRAVVRQRSLGGRSLAA